MSKKRKTPKFLTKEDVMRLYCEAQRVNPERGYKSGKSGSFAYGHNAFVIMLILTTGMRIGETLALTWSDVDFNKRLLSINKNLVFVRNEARNNDLTGENALKPIITSPKTKASHRTIHMSDISFWALTTLKDAQQSLGCFTETGAVCLNKCGRIISVRNLRRTLNYMLKTSNCSLHKCGLHALRHSFGSILLAEGVDIKVISTLLGHTNVSMTYNVYIHIVEKQKVEALEVFNFTLPNIIPPSNNNSI